MFLTKEQLYHKVENCRTKLIECGITEPITLEKICSYFSDIEVGYLPFKTHGLRGMVSLANEESPVHCILINSTLPKVEQNFHGIHELMHIYLHSRTENKAFHCYDKIRPNQDSALEWQANEGSAEFLMPYKTFIPNFCNLLDLYCNDEDRWLAFYGNKTSITDVLAIEYDLSGKVIQNRISSLSYEIDQFQSGVPIDRIELLSYTKRKTFGITTTNYLQQIFQLDQKYFNMLAWNSIIN